MGPSHPTLPRLNNRLTWANEWLSLFVLIENLGETIIMGSRRKFISICAAVVASAAVVPVDWLAWLEKRSRTMSEISYKELAAQVGTTFRLQAGSGRQVKLKLLKAPLARPYPWADDQRPPEDAHHEKFSLFFSGPPESVLASAIHQFEHAELGRFEMYIGEVGAREALSIHYESVFNRPPVAKCG